MLQLGVSTVAPGIFTQVTRMVLISLVSSATISIIVYFLAWRNPLDFRLGHAIIVIFLALAATGSTEHVREMLRKPYVIVQHMYSNGLRKSEVEKANREGYLIRSPWVREEERKVWEAMDLKSIKDAKDIKDRKDAAQAAGAAKVDATAAEALKDPSQFAYAVQKRAQLARGELVMRGQCYACHTMNGYRSLRKLFRLRDAQATANILKMLHEQPQGFALPAPSCRRSWEPPRKSRR